MIMRYFSFFIQIFILFNICATLVGCISDTVADSPPSVTGYTPRKLHIGSHPENGSFTKKQIKIINSESDYATELAIYSSESVKTVDFSVETIILSISFNLSSCVNFILVNPPFTPAKSFIFLFEILWLFFLMGKNTLIIFLFLITPNTIRIIFKQI